MDPVVMMVGAGVSMAAPTCLPNWAGMARAIAEALRAQYANELEIPDRLRPQLDALDVRRGQGRLPPDYQAQLLEEMAGLRYFEGLQALDVTVCNENHEAIAELVSVGGVVAVVTTNFDRLLEQALERRKIAFEAYFTAEHFAALARTPWPPSGPVRILKLHGCVSCAASMIDTLKQRKRGRSRDLQQCLNAIPAARWVFAGFSAADLETNPNYLGFESRAAVGPGATYLRRRGSNLGLGAVKLRAAYGLRWEEVEGDVAAWIGSRFHLPPPPAASSETGQDQFVANLSVWASTLPLAAAGICLAALLEASGDAEAAARVLDRLLRKEILQSDRQDDDFRLCQLHYGRLGAAWGRYAAVPDLNGGEANASVESLQSLLRLIDSPLAFAATTWLAPAFLWRGCGMKALATTSDLLEALHDRQALGLSGEQVADAWIAAAQVCIIDGSRASLDQGLTSATPAFEAAMESGDVVRAARVAALHLLLLANTTTDVAAFAVCYDEIFGEVKRVHDGYSDGLRRAALGRSRVGYALAEVRGEPAAAQMCCTALHDLSSAAEAFQEQVVDPWLCYTWLQCAKAHCGLGDLSTSQTFGERAGTIAARLPSLLPHVYETRGYICSLIGDPNAERDMRLALQTARELGLEGRAELLINFLSDEASH